MSWLLNNPIGDRWDETVRHYTEMYENQVLKGSLTISLQYEIASVLVRSKCSAYIRRGINILEHLCASVEILATHRSYLLYLAIGYIRIKEYDLGQNCVNRLLLIDPGNRQAMELEVCIQEHKQQDLENKNKQQREELESYFQNTTIRDFGQSF
jgi:hypothetical protein